MKKLLLPAAVAAICCHGAKAQYVADPTANTQVTETVSNYGSEAVVNEDGILFSHLLLPESGDDGNTYISHCLQVLDKEGNKVLPDGGSTLCSTRNRSYIMVNQLTYADNDGNCILIACDCRNAAPSDNSLGYTVYKVDAEGNVLWNTDLADGEVFANTAMLKVVQTTDGGYVLAYAVFDDADSTPMYVRMEKLTADGQKAWEEPVLLQDSRTPYGYPYIVDAGDNQVLLIYARTSSLYLEAQLYDFDGSPLWPEALTIYQGGFGSTPMQSMVNVEKAPEGAFIAWHDDRSYEGSYSNYVAYVKRDGTLGLNGVANGLKISYADEYSRQVPQLYFCEEDQSLYAIYRQYNQSYQSMCGIYMQCISTEGELMWGAEGKAVVAIQGDRSVGYATVQGAGGTDVAAFYQTNAQSGGDVKTYAVRMDNDGNAVWDAPTEVCTVVSEKSDLLSSQLIDGSYWVLTWSDLRESPDLYHEALFAQRVNTDGTLGIVADGIGRIEEDKAIGAADIYTIDGRFAGSTDSDGKLGQLARGIYIVRDKATGQTRKVSTGK